MGTGPTSWAATTARLQSEVERSLADEAQNTPLAALITVPTDGGDGSDQDPLRLLKADIRTARGKGLFVETVATGYGEGRGGAPHRDFHPLRMDQRLPRHLRKSGRAPLRRYWPRAARRPRCSWGAVTELRRESPFVAGI